MYLELSRTFNSIQCFKGLDICHLPFTFHRPISSLVPCECNQRRRLFTGIAHFDNSIIPYADKLRDGITGVRIGSVRSDLKEDREGVAEESIYITE
jgi:hypothetical protein